MVSPHKFIELGHPFWVSFFHTKITRFPRGKYREPQSRGWPEKKDSGRKEQKMLDWLKEILGDSYTEEIDKSVSQKIGSLFVSKADFNAKNEAKKQVDAQLEEANKKLEGFDPDWAEKVKQASKEAEEKVKKFQRQQAVDKCIGEIKFSSEAAKKAFKMELLEKGLPFENDKLLGLNDYIEEYKQSDPSAFASDKPAPTFGGPTPGVNNKVDTSKMTYSQLAQYLAENPDAQI